MHIHEQGGVFELARAAFGASKVDYERDPKILKSMSFLGISDHVGNLLYSIGQKLANAITSASPASQPGKGSDIAAQAREAFFSRGGLNIAVRMAFQAAQQGSRAASSPPLPRRRNSAPNPSTFANQPWANNATRTGAERLYTQSALPPRLPKVDSEKPFVPAGRVGAAPSAKSAAKPLYQHMGLMQDASPDDIKKTYKKDVLKHHPDKNRYDPNAGERFQLFQNAYEILSNPEKKLRYDKGEIDEQGHDVEPLVTPSHPQSN